MTFVDANIFIYRAQSLEIILARLAGQMQLSTRWALVRNIFTCNSCYLI